MSRYPLLTLGWSWHPLIEEIQKKNLNQQHYTLKIEQETLIKANILK